MMKSFRVLVACVSAIAMVGLVISVRGDDNNVSAVSAGASKQIDPPVSLLLLHYRTVGPSWRSEQPQP
jgi:hypothetical protein